MFKASAVLNSGFLDQPRAKVWQSLVENYAVDEDAYLRELSAAPVGGYGDAGGGSGAASGRHPG